MRVKIFENGWRIKYAPMIPAIAPLAPIVGTLEFKFKSKWEIPEAIPQSR